MSVSQASTPFRGLLTLAVATGLALSLMAGWSAFGQATPPFDARCEAWDASASAAVGGLVADRDRAVEQRLGDAVFRLRRARKYCRYGFISLARFDYQALLDGRYAGRAPASPLTGQSTSTAAVQTNSHSPR